MRSKHLITYLTIIIFALILPISAISSDKEVIVINEPLQVEVTNPSVMQTQLPFCPCFSTEEINNAFNGITAEATCDDDRVLLGTDVDAATKLGYGGGADPGFIVGARTRDGITWECIMGDVLPGNELNLIVYFTDIGFTNAMACRLAIMNSTVWTETGCPNVLE